MSVGVIYAFGVVRVSEVGGRDASRVRRVDQRVRHTRSRARRPHAAVDTFRSDDEQRLRMHDAALVNGWELAIIRTELDVSGKRPLKKRPGLLEAVEAVESGQVKVVMVAYFDRLARNIDVKREVVRRIEAAGGRVFAVDFGGVSHVTAIQELTSDFLAAMSGYISRSTGERLAVTQAAAIAEGLPIGTIAPGYRQDPETFRLVVDEDEARVMREAFEMRADGASWGAVRKHMASGGIVRSAGSVRKLLHSRTYLGELYHGNHSNPDSHEAIVDQATFERVQRQTGETFKAVPGRKSPLLLAGLRILKCSSCHNSLAVASQVQRGKRTPLYRCNPNLDCSRRVAISAEIADDVVAAVVRHLLAEVSATAGGMELTEARVEQTAEHALLARMIRNLAMVADEGEAQAVLAEQRARCDAIDARVAELERRIRVIGNATTLNAAADWNALGLAARREIISAVLERVVVDPGHRHFRGAARLHFQGSGGQTLSVDTLRLALQDSPHAI